MQLPKPDHVVELYPQPGRLTPIRNLYLEAPLAPPDWGDRIYVYTNFVTSLDGRIALPDPAIGLPIVPDTIANPRDWRLFQELAARADVLLASGSYLRALARGIAQDSLPLSDKPGFEDLRRWRLERGRPAQPDVMVVSASLDIELPLEWFAQGRRVYVATSADPAAPRARALAAQGAEVVQLKAGDGIDGRAAVRFLEERGYRRLYSVTGPYVLHTLLRDDLIDTLFLTTVHRLVGGDPAPGFVEGPTFRTPLDLRLRWLYLDPHAHGENRGQSLARYDRAR